MKTLTSSATIVSSPFYLPIFSPKSKDPSSIGRRILRFSISPKNNDNQSELRSNSNDSCLVPILSNRTLSKDAVMGLVLSAANVRGWTTDSGMEGPPVPAGSESESSTEKISTFPCSLFTKSPRRRMRVAFTCNVCGQGTTRAINPHVYTEVPAGSESESSTEKISTFPWSLFTKSPRRRMRVAFTCNVCGQRTTRAINPHAYTDGTVFVQCCECNVFHKLVDNLLPERLSISNMLPSSLPVEALHKSAINVNSGDCQRRFPCNYIVYQLGGGCRSWFGPIWCC